MVIAPGWHDPYEETPELQFPANLRVYDRMRRQDSQVRAMLRAIALPILQTPWRVLGAGCRPEVVNFVTAELGLVADELGRRRSRDGGVSFDPFLRMSLLHLVFGFMPFNKWATIAPFDTGLDLGIGPQVAHLGGLSPRMPRSVQFIDVNSDGSLIGIRQWAATNLVRGAYPGYGGQGNGGYWPNASGFMAPAGDAGLVPIPAEALVYFVNEQEGADWAGMSVLRSAYKHWLIKDFLLHVDANAADRNGTGLPVITYPSAKGEAGRNKALAVASAVRAGDEAGVALEEGYTLALLGVQGGTHDTLASIAYHDQAAARGMLEMFLNLGHDGGLGHGSLGETFVDYFLLSLRAVLRYSEEVITEQIVRDLVRWNFGPSEPYPTVVADDPSAEATPTAAALEQLTAAGLLVADPGARAEIRRRYGLPGEGDEAVSIPYLLPRGVTDPSAPANPTGLEPTMLPTGPWLPPRNPGRLPPPNPGPPTGGPPALPPGAGGGVDRRGQMLSAGQPVAVALAGALVPGTFLEVTPAGLAVAVAGIRAYFQPAEVRSAIPRRLAAAPPSGEGLAELLARTRVLSERLLAAAARAGHPG